MKLFYLLVNSVISKPYLFFYILLSPAILFADGPLIGIHISETQSIASYQNKITVASGLGIKVIRIPVDWNVLGANQDSYDISYIVEIKARVAFAEAQSQKVVMMMSQSPSWSNGGNNPSFPPTEAHYSDYADAMAFLHAQLIDPTDNYQINTSTIMAWEVWNEPNVIEFWPTKAVRSGTFVLIDLSAASDYADFLEVTYNTMKSQYPQMTILGGSLASADTDYLNAMYVSWDGVAKFDHLALHPYTRVDDEGDGVSNPHYGKAQYPDQCNIDDTLAPPWCYKQGVENIRQLLDSKGDTTKQIWFTEFGTASDNEFGGAGSVAEQKEHMKRALDILQDWFIDGDAMKIRVARS
jgi:hypothetical protein